VELGDCSELVGGKEQRVDAHDRVDPCVLEARVLEAAKAVVHLAAEIELDCPRPCCDQRAVGHVQPEDARAGHCGYPKPGATATAADIEKLVVLADPKRLRETMKLGNADVTVGLDAFWILLAEYLTPGASLNRRRRRRECLVEFLGPVTPTHSLPSSTSTARR
jgi:hypothetical protein